MPRTRISGRRLLFILAAAVLIVTAILYFFIIRLKLGGTDAIRLRPAPAAGTSPSH